MKRFSYSFANREIPIHSHNVLHTATTCFGPFYDYHQVAYNYDKKLKPELCDII